MVRKVAIAGAVVSMLLLAACGTGGTRNSSHAPVWVALRDFAVWTDVDSVTAGLVTFRVENAGSGAHDLQVFRTNLEVPDIPLQGGQIREGVEGLEEIGKLAELDPGYVNLLSVDLAPGRYLLVCNMPGHFQQGMWHVLEAG